MKTSELIGPALNWAVAKCEGRDYNRLDGSGWTTDCFNPSTDWAQGGPIIEREGVQIYRHNRIFDVPHCWTGIIYCKSNENSVAIHCDGPTPLIAAMRCYVASVFGGEIEIPEELK